MKQISKYLIKLLYVIIIPLSVTYVFIEVLASDGTISTESIGLMFAFWIISFFNAVFWLINMKTTHLLPKMKCQWNTGFGIYMRKVNFHWELDLPFLTIIFQRRK
tara:strand:- start:2996 stop:3310 length:315 start_codon:yes stop_codon:yes gene_type:complete